MKFASTSSSTPSSKFGGSLLLALTAALTAAAGCSSTGSPSQWDGATGGTTTSSSTTGGTTTSGTTASAGAGGGSIIGAGAASSVGSGGASGGGLASGGSGVLGSAGGGPGAGGGANTGNSGGMANQMMGAGGTPPCEDVEPPPDPEWPGATCENWSNETTACGEDWFKDYCDVSCGRCVPEDGSGPPMPPDCSGENLPNVSGGNGHASRYWDCCQTHCGQQSGQGCNQDGSPTGGNQSACTGGHVYACYSEAPHAVSECLAYGHVARAQANCGGCYRIQFTGEGHYSANDIGSKLIQGKQMIVKVSNTGVDVAGDQMDLMIPGGGVGIYNACSNQWGTNDLGEQYGGFLSSCAKQHMTHSAKKDCVRQNCMKLPAGDARDGCLWFVDWFQIADNPKFTSEPTNCPF